MGLEESLPSQLPCVSSTNRAFSIHHKILHPDGRELQRGSPKFR